MNDNNNPTPPPRDETRTHDSAASPEHPTAPIPDRIGRYHILGKLGEGGMGVVYEAARSSVAQFSTDCVLFGTVGTNWSDGAVPAAGDAFNYLARPDVTNGSWGRDSSGAERVVNCPSFL